jgi:hypothetical protein
LRVNISDVYNPLKGGNNPIVFLGKQPIACLKRETTLSGSDIVENITDGRFAPYITGCVVNVNINMK